MSKKTLRTFGVAAVGVLGLVFVYLLAAHLIDVGAPVVVAEALVATVFPMPTVVAIPTLMPPGAEFGVFSQPGMLFVDVSADELLSRHSPMDRIVVAPGWSAARNSRDTASFITLAGKADLSSLDIPEGTLLGSSPCGVGTTMPKTGSGYTFDDPRCFHPAFDGYCDGLWVRATAAGVVWQALDNRVAMPAGPPWASNTTGYGFGYILATQVRAAELPQNAQDALGGVETAIAIHVYGHLRYPLDGDPVFAPGDYLEAGTLLGNLSPSTGVSTGAHLHYGVAVVLPNGNLLWINPRVYGGAR